jgi:hypothetical protein
MRQAIEAHAGEALAARQAFDVLADYERECVIEFLKTLQILPSGTKLLVIGEDKNAN